MHLDVAVGSAAARGTIRWLCAVAVVVVAISAVMVNSCLATKRLTENQIEGEDARTRTTRQAPPLRRRPKPPVAGPARQVFPGTGTGAKRVQLPRCAGLGLGCKTKMQKENGEGRDGE